MFISHSGVVMKKIAVFLLAASAALSVWAQPKVVGKLNNVQGLVTVSAGDQLANAVSGAPLIVGNRIITTSSGAVTLSFDNGCDVTLKANESITVQEGRDCAALLASVSPVGAPVAVAAGGSSLLPGLIATGGAIAIIIGSNNKNKTSGS